MLSSVASAVPAGKAASKAKGAGKAPKGLALLGAAGGLAAVLKNRDKLTSKMGRGEQTETVPVAPAVTSVPEPNPVAVRPEGTLGDNSAPGSV